MTNAYALLLLIASHAPLDREPNNAPPPGRVTAEKPFPVGPTVAGSLIGAFVGGVVAGTTFVVGISEAQNASGCQAEECEGFGLTLFFYTLPVAFVGTVAGAVGGGAAGYLLANVLAE